VARHNTKSGLVCFAMKLRPCLRGTDLPRFGVRGSQKST
jgi:hypothetical protein